MAQFKALSFTTKGYAMEDGLEKSRGLYEIIVAWPKSRTPMANAIQEMESRKVQNIYRNVATHSPEEAGELQPGLVRYLIVGYTPRPGATDLELSKLAEWQRRMPVGGVLPDVILPWDDKRPPIFVVTETGVAANIGGVGLWALLRPEGGLCTPYSVAQDRVFYRHEFRDLTKSNMARGANWNKLVVKHASQPQVNQATGHSPPQIVALPKLIADPGSFTLEDARAAEEELSAQWPEVKGVTANAIHSLAVGLERRGFVASPLEHHMLRGFIAEGCHRLGQLDHNDDPDDLEAIASETMETVQRILPTRKSALDA